MEPISVRYQKAPLIDTIFQLRFSPILQIETEIPASFQEKIRHKYPEYTTENQFHQEISGNVESNQFINETRLTTTKIHVFSDSGEQTIVRLTRDSISLQTKNYRGWSIFKEDLLDVLHAFYDSYNGFAPTRIGLRYINILERTQLGLEKNIPWKTLLNDLFIGFYADDKYCSDISSFDVKTNISLSSNFGINIALASVVNVNSNEPCLRLDFDCYSSSIAENISEDIEMLHDYDEEFFFHAIKPELHEAMQPI